MRGTPQGGARTSRGQREASGRTILSREIITRTVADPFIDSIVLILTGFGLVILVLSGFLVVNAISALITQQIPQIGVMKLIGARRWQIMRLYLATVLIYGLLAVVVALPARGVDRPPVDDRDGGAVAQRHAHQL